MSYCRKHRLHFNEPEDEQGQHGCPRCGGVQTEDSKPEAPEEKMISISSSSIEAAECPFYYHEEYISGHRAVQDGPDTPHNLLFGRMAHMVAEKYVRTLIRKKMTADIDAFQQILEVCWESNVYMPESKHDELVDVMLPWAETFSIDPDKVWGAEVELAFNWILDPVAWDAPDKWLRAKLDRVEIYPDVSLAVIEDYKTGFYVPPVKKQQQALQTIIYPFTLHLRNPYLEHFRMVFNYIRWNKQVVIDFHMPSAVPLSEDSIPFDPGKIETKLRTFTERMLKKIADPEAEWPAIRCTRCAICRYECPLLTMGITPLRTEQQAADMAGQIAAMEAKVKELKDALKDFTKATETAVPVHGGEWGWKVSETRRGVKAAKIVDYAQQQERPDLLEVLKVDMKKARKLGDSGLLDLIGKMGKASLSSKFGFQKISDTPEEDEE